MPIPFSEIFVDPFVVGVLFGMKLELEVVKAPLSDFAFAKKLKGDAVVVPPAGVLLKPVNPPNALLVDS